MVLVLSQLNSVHILTLIAFQHAVLTRSIPCFATTSATGIGIKIDHSVLQPVTWGASGLWNYWVCNWLILVQGVLGSFLQFKAHVVFALPKFTTGYSLPPVCCHIQTDVIAVLHLESKLLSLWCGGVLTAGAVHSLSTFCEQPDTCVGEQHLGQFSYVENCRMSPTGKQPESNFLTSFFVVSFLFSVCLLYVYLHACVLSPSFHFSPSPFPFFFFSFPMFISSFF